MSASGVRDAESGEVAGGGVARAAAAGAEEIGSARFGVPGQDVDWGGGRAVAGDGLDALAEEVRDVNDLVGGQCGLVRRGRRAHRRADVAAEPIAEHGRRANQIGAIRTAFRGTAVTVDAVSRVEAATARRGSWIDLLPIRWSSLCAEERRRQQATDRDDESEQAMMTPSHRRHRHIAGFDLTM